MDEKFMKVLREQQEIQQKAARILSRPIVPCTFVRIGSPFTHSSKII